MPLHWNKITTHKAAWTNFNPPPTIKFHLSDGSSFLIAQLKRTVMNIPGKYKPFIYKEFIYMFWESECINSLLIELARFFANDLFLL